MEEETAEDIVSSPKEIEQELSDSELVSIVNIKYTGLIRVLLNDNELAVTTRPLILAFHNFKKLYKQLVPWCNLMAKIAETYQERIDFAIADFSASLTVGSKLNKFNFKLLGRMSGPRIYAFDLQNNEFRMEKFLNGEMLIEFIDSLLAGKLFISEPIPAANSERHLQTAVGLNLKEIISNSDKDILLLFYERWTHDAIALLKEFKELARMLQHEDLLVAKMNVEENHIPPDFNISSYPRCIYIRTGDKNNYIHYKGGTITIESLLEFIATHSTTELKCCDRNGMLKEELGNRTELHLESIENIMSFIKDNYDEHIRVLKDVKEIKQTEKPLVVAFHNYIKFNMQLEPWYDVIEEVAKAFQGKLDFALADISSLGVDNPQFEYTNFKVNTQPLVYAFNTTGTQCKMDGHLSIVALADFSHKLLHDELLTTEPLSVMNVESLVKVATTENFRELVLDSAQNVFIVFYAPWCCSTTSLIPLLDHLANLLKEDTDQLVVKINGTTEKVPLHYRATYYPRCFYIRKGESRRNFQCHDYPRTVENFIHFIAEISSSELKYYDRDGFLRKEHKLPYKEILSVNDMHLSEHCRNNYAYDNEIKKSHVSKYKLGNIITTFAFEGLLQLRDANEEEPAGLI